MIIINVMCWPRIKQFKLLHFLTLYLSQWMLKVIVKHNYVDLRYTHKNFEAITNITIPRKKLDFSDQSCWKIWDVPTVEQDVEKNHHNKIKTFDRNRNGLTSKLHSSMGFSYSFSTVHQVCNTSLSSLQLLNILWSVPFSCLCTSLLISVFATLACTSIFHSALD